MVRGNWQRRVEQTEARKAMSRHRRSQKEIRSSNKTMVAQLFNQMDQFDVTSGTLHVWTDTRPRADDLTQLSEGDLLSPNTLYRKKLNDDPIDDDDDDFESQEFRFVTPKRRSRAASFSEGGRRDRSGSFSELNNSRGRSGSFPETTNTPSSGKGRRSADGTGSAKKHPRSREPNDQALPEESSVFSGINLCRSQFFKGKCDSLKSSACRRGVTCSHLHYNSLYHKTLFDVLTHEQKELLENTEIHVKNSSIEEVDDGGMEMCYYFSIPMGQQSESEVSNSSSPSQILSRALSGKSCSNSSLVYVAYENELIFDRNQTGVLLSELGIVFGGVRRYRSTSVVSEVSVMSEASKDVEDSLFVANVPIVVLEYILTFLPDNAVACMARVCRAWYVEIGRSSSNLWRYLLDRRQWPHPVTGSDHDAERCFKIHYQVVRDVLALKNALSTLVNPRRNALEEIEMVYQSFGSRRTAPAKHNSCVAMQVWSPNEVLAAYSQDCTVRLFKAVEKGPTGGRACREINSVRVDPFRKTAKRKVRLVAMALDDETIGCLLHVQGIKDEDFILSILSRNDYLESAGGDLSSVGWSEPGEGILNVIHIGQAVINHLLSTDDVVNQLLNLSDFLNGGGEMTDIEVLVSKCVVSCGQGKFLVEASISVPDFDADQDDDDEWNGQYPMILLDRKLIIFSTHLSSIVWMGDSNPTQSFLPRRHDLMLSGVMHEGRNQGCSVVAVSSFSPTILVTEIDGKSHQNSVTHIKEAELVRANMLAATSPRGWELDTSRRRPVALFSDVIVAVDVLVHEQDHESFRKYRSILSFYTKTFFRSLDDHIYQTCVLEDCNVLYMERLREEHVLLVCEEPERQNHFPYNVDADEVDESETESQDDSSNSPDIGLNQENLMVLNVIIVHVPTRHLIDRIPLPVDPKRHEEMIVVFKGNTIGVGVGWKGIVMTGADIRAVGQLNKSQQQLAEDEQSNLKSNNSAKKKKRLGKKETTKGRAFRGKGMRC
jgi:hypothetical protein